MARRRTVKQTATGLTKLLGTREVARDILDVSEATLDQWAWKGVGPTFVKVGGLRRYRREDVEAWLESNTVEPRGAA